MGAKYGRLTGDCVRLSGFRCWHGSSGTALWRFKRQRSRPPEVDRRRWEGGAAHQPAAEGISGTLGQPRTTDGRTAKRG